MEEQKGSGRTRVVMSAVRTVVSKLFRKGAEYNSFFESLRLVNALRTRRAGW